MFDITKDKTICITRGDVATMLVGASLQGTDPYTFAVGDVVRMQVFGKKNCENIVMRKDVVVESETETVALKLTGEDTKIGEIINKPVDYWYSIQLNPDTEPQTIIGYDESGEKIFRLYPEGADTL